MARDEYFEYHYLDPSNEYIDPGSLVLKNSLNLQDAEILQLREHELSANRLLDLLFDPIMVHSMEDVRAIHHYLFQDIYAWAGKYRKVNISKEGNAFMAMQSFEMGEQYLDELIKHFCDETMSKPRLAASLAEILDNLNYMHPFREGNGRTQREVVRVLALEKGYYCEIDIQGNDEIYHLYMDGTVYGDKERLKQLFLRILTEIKR